MIKHRKIHLVGDIDPAQYSIFSEKLDELLAKDAYSPIDIELCSGGGSDNIAFAFYGRMQSSTAPFHITAYGEVYSAAILILAAGDKRMVDAATSLMVHETSDDLSGETHALKREVERLDLAEIEFYSRLAACTKVSLKGWMAMSEETTYFNAAQALEYGLADEVVGLTKNRKTKPSGKSRAK